MIQDDIAFRSQPAALFGAPRAVKHGLLRHYGPGKRGDQPNRVLPVPGDPSMELWVERIRHDEPLNSGA